MLLRTQRNCNIQSVCGNHSDCTPVSAVSDVRLRLSVSTALRVGRMMRPNN
jgi:hypothetical protein